MKSILDMLNDEKDVQDNSWVNMENPEVVKTAEAEEEPIFMEIVDEGDEGREKARNDILNMVLDDTFIKAESSPFMTYPDDKQDFLGQTNYVDLGKAIQQYRNGEIDSRMLRVLDIIIQHKYISSRQIWQLCLLRYGLYIKRDSLRRLLNRMVDKCLVVEFMISSSMGGTNYHIYCPDYNGVRLSTALGAENINWKRTDTLQKPYIVKRSLARTQFLIAYLKYYDVDYKVQPKLMWNEGSGRELAVVPALQLTFKLRQRPDSIVFLVEVIRTYHGWEEKYSEKLLRYGKYMKSVEDTQSLKKYYVVVCAESPEQVKDAAKIFYNLRHVKKVEDIKGLKLFYTHDLELLDQNIETNLLDNLKSLEFNYDTNAWDECCLDFEFEQKDWHDIEFEKENIQEEVTRKNYIKLEDKQEIAMEIYKIVRKQGWKLPQSITRLALPLRDNGIDYNRLGYKRLKNLFEDLSEYYIIDYESPTVMINCTDSFNNTMNEKERNGENRGEYNQEKTDVIVERGYGKNIIADYFTTNVKNRIAQKKIFMNDVYCFRNWDFTVALAEKITGVNDLSKNGWFNVLAHSYCLAKKEDRVICNTSRTYMYFDTGLLSVNGKKIYLLMKKNYRIRPEWILEGLSTAASKVLGEILREEFGL